MNPKRWLDDLLSRWYIPREDYDTRLTESNKVTRDNAAMFRIHQDYVRAQLQAPDLHQMDIPRGHTQLTWYSRPETWPPLWNQPSYMKVEMQQVEEHCDVLEFRAVMQVDRATLKHYTKYSAGLFRDIAQRLLLSLLEKVLS